MLPVPALTLGIHLVVAVQSMPSFDVNPTCAAAARSGAQLTPNKDACMRSELGARNQLARQWNAFPSADRSSCGDLATLSASKSYVQLLTCLELARDARKIRAAPASGTPRR